MAGGRKTPSLSLCSGILDKIPTWFHKEQDLIPEQIQKTRLRDS